MNFSKIKSTLLGSNKLLGFFSIFFSSIFIFLYSQNIVIEKNKLLLKTSSEKAVKEIENLFDQNESFMLFIAKKISNKNHINLDYINKQLISTGDLKIKSLTKSYISWANHSGTTIVSGKKGILTPPYSSIKNRSYFLECKIIPWIIKISKPTESLFSTRRVLPTAMGVCDNHGKFQGYLLLGLKTEELKKDLTEIVNPNVELSLYYKEELVFTSDKSKLKTSLRNKVLFFNTNISRSVSLEKQNLCLFTNFKSGYIPKCILEEMMKNFSLFSFILILYYISSVFLKKIISKRLLFIIKKNNIGEKSQIELNNHLLYLLKSKNDLNSMLNHVDMYFCEFAKELQRFNSINPIIKRSENEWKKFILQINKNGSYSITEKFFNVPGNQNNLENTPLTEKNTDLNSFNLPTEVFNVNSLIEKSISINELRAFNKDIKIDYDGLNLLENLQIEKFEFQKVVSSLINLAIENSKKYTQIQIKTHLIHKEIRNILCFRITFTGFGLSKEELEEISYKINRETMEVFDPTRLDISEITNLIDKFNGQMFFENENQERTTIKIYWPIYLVTNHEIYKDKTSKKQSYH